MSRSDITAEEEKPLGARERMKLESLREARKAALAAQED